MNLYFTERFPWGEASNFEQKILDGTKIHTIRRDPNYRWREGMTIHFRMGTRWKSKLFATGTVEKVGGVLISPPNHIVQLWSSPRWRRISDTGLAELAKNDGFDSVKDFWKWFNDEPFAGRIIYFGKVGKA
jgi:hypothetical protein